jgi:hypothetical protein
MISKAIQRVMRAWKLGISLLGVFLVTTSVSPAQSAYQITDSGGNVLSASSSLYTSSYSCYNSGGPPMPATICTWVLRKLYGDMSAVAVFVDQPHGSAPGCVNGGTQVLASGYTRSGCIVYATAAAYGH